MFDTLTTVGKRYGMEMNLEKTKILRISMQSSPLQIVIDQKQLESVEHYSCLGSKIKKLCRMYITCEIKSRIAMEIETFNRKNTLFTRKLDLNLRKKLIKC